MEKTADTTALQNDYAYHAVDDYNTRMYILPFLQDRTRRKALIAEHRAGPIYGPTEPGKPAPVDSPELARLLDKLRVMPQKGKHVIVEIRPWVEYRIGILPGVRGKPIQITEEAYTTRAEAEHAIFLKRLTALCKAYGIED
jgi:hypothetical protein